MVSVLVTLVLLSRLRARAREERDGTRLPARTVEPTSHASQCEAEPTKAGSGMPDQPARSNAAGRQPLTPRLSAGWDSRRESSLISVGFGEEN
ncbi:unnamed protein product [Rangifer tarandus platyrhynchus]|uniref:Secreted protein n=1 Tax=Rangifer tarandus platyrhynchus TaxID=3082113 RepID=A0ABN8Z8R3_RANTA|nr:unnamed protein product [Rangifer tarandus platyrhynchus]